MWCMLYFHYAQGRKVPEGECVYAGESWKREEHFCSCCTNVKLII